MISRSIFLALAGMLFFACQHPAPNAVADEEQMNTMLDAWHAAAGRADFTDYFEHFTDSAVFTGTDATERWNKKQFMVWAKPYFDKGKAWNFTSLERHIYTAPAGNIAWFDELLKTQMEICRGSGVLVKDGAEWKIEQYILSTTIPNSMLDSIAKVKAALEEKVISQLAGK